MVGVGYIGEILIERTEGSRVKSQEEMTRAA